MKLKEEFKRFTTFILDCDGVIWRGSKPIISAIRAIKELKSQEKKVVFTTNNSTLSRKGYFKKFKNLSIDVNEDEIFPSSHVTALYLSSRGGGRAFVIGEEGLIEELNSHNVKVAELEENADYVVVGMDRGLTYWKLARAFSLIRKGAMFVVTNRDRTLPTSRGEIPGAGSIVAALEEATGKAPDVEIGKPSPLMFKLVLKKLGIDKDEALVIGDRIETDILGARRLGISSALVLTGISKREDMLKNNVKPNYVLETLLDLFECSLS